MRSVRRCSAPDAPEPEFDWRGHTVTQAVAGVGLIAASDPGSTRLVYAMVIGLVVVGVSFLILAIWLIRRTRVDPAVLGPLERMGQRRWQRTDPVTQRRQLDAVRPPGAVPLQRQPDPPTFVADFEQVAPPSSLSDLGPGLAPPVLDVESPASDSESSDVAPDGSATPEGADGVAAAGPVDAPDADDADDAADADDADEVADVADAADPVAEDDAPDADVAADEADVGDPAVPAVDEDAPDSVGGEEPTGLRW